MDLSTVQAGIAAISAFAAAIVALVALVPTWRAARAAEEQTKLQRELMEQAAQPYVWVDVQPDSQQEGALQLVLGNYGPTVAHNVRVVFTPPLPTDPGFGSGDRSQERLREGILSLAPGRTIRWMLGTTRVLLADASDQTIHRAQISATGPYGRVQKTETEIRFSDWRESRDAPDGSLHHVRQEIRELTKAVKALQKKQ